MYGVSVEVVVGLGVRVVDMPWSTKIELNLGDIPTLALELPSKIANYRI